MSPVASSFSAIAGKIGLTNHHDLEVKESAESAESTDVESVKEIQPQVKEVHPQGKDAESVKEIQSQVEEVNVFRQQRQAELDEWQAFRNAHCPAAKAHEQVPHDAIPSQPQAEQVNSFTQERQAELDEWRKFSEAHEHRPKEFPNPIRILEDLFDISSSSSTTAAPVAANSVAGVSSWSRRRRGRRSSGHVSFGV